jgi:hypothetical protein
MNQLEMALFKISSHALTFRQRHLKPARSLAQIISAVDRRVVFDVLQVHSFDDAEIERSYRTFSGAVPGDEIHKHAVTESILSDKIAAKLKDSGSSLSSSAVMSVALRPVPDRHSNDLVTLSTYKSRILAAADRLDERVWSLALSFLLVGSSIGVS